MWLPFLSTEKWILQGIQEKLPSKNTGPEDAVWAWKHIWRRSLKLRTTRTHEGSSKLDCFKKKNISAWTKLTVLKNLGNKSMWLNKQNQVIEYRKTNNWIWKSKKTCRNKEMCWSLHLWLLLETFRSAWQNRNYFESLLARGFLLRKHWGLSCLPCTGPSLWDLCFALTQLFVELAHVLNTSNTRRRCFPIQ